MVSGISIISLIIAIASYMESSESNEIARSAQKFVLEQDASNKSIVLTATFDNNLELMKIKPTIDSFNLQYSMVYFPEKIWGTPITAENPELAIQLFGVSEKLIQDAENKYAKALSAIDNNNDTTVAAYSDLLPIVIKSNYTTQGNIFNKRAVYYISYNVILYADKRAPKLEFKNLSFISNINTETEISKYLNDKWSQ